MAAAHSHAHWLVPTTLALATLFGAALAFGHHVFYSKLNGSKIEEARWTQDTNISIGTAFTFLVRSALVIAVSTAYWQVFWRRLHRPLPLSSIDGLATQLQDAYQLLNFNNIKVSPLLCAIALFAWLIPVAVVFPPSALKVVPQRVSSQEMVPTGIPDYSASENFVPSAWNGEGITKRNGTGQTLSEVSAYWGGPSTQVRRTLFGTAYQGQLPLLTGKLLTMIAPNSSFTLEFDGPSLQCDEANNSSGIAVELTNAGVPCLNGSTACLNAANSYFVSWVANGTNDHKAYATWGRVPYAIGTTEPEYLGTDWRHAQAIFVAHRDINSTKGASAEGITILNCTLYNTTYNIAATYVDGEQSVSMQSTRTRNPVRFLSQDAKGQNHLEFPGAFSLNDPRVKSYLSLMQIIGELLVGHLYWDVVHKTAYTQILSTDLAYTDALWPVYRNYTGLSPDLEPPNLVWLPFKDTLEELFRNMTLSLLSISSVHANLTEMISVSVTYTYNAYAYSPQRLWAPYGAAIMATLMAVAVGFFNLVSSGASYSNKFSTIVRVSHDRAIDIAIRDEDRYGQDPLPKYIGKAKLFVRGLKDREMESSRSSVQASGLPEPAAEGLMTGRSTLGVAEDHSDQ